MSAACLHCGSPLSAAAAAGAAAAARFCCAGCEAAYRLIDALGLDAYYRRRTLDPRLRGPKPEFDLGAAELEPFLRRDGRGAVSLDLLVDGLHCGACVWLIETILQRQAGVLSARASLTTRRLALRWRDGETDAAALVAAVAAVGYRCIPYDPARLAALEDRTGRALLKAMAVAGFAAGNVMLLSVAVWAGHAEGMSQATRDLLHWLSALVVLPALAYAGRPFFASALTALRAGRTNMDVPIALAILLVPAMSLAETMRSGPHAYFDSAITLTFFLLLGRYLEHRARGRARAAAEQLVALGASSATVIEADGRFRSLLPAQLQPGMTLLVPTGGRIAADGAVLGGAGEIDTSLVTGEALPRSVGPGAAVFAGSLNLGPPLRLAVTAAGEDTLLAEIARLMEAAERGKTRFVALADRVARRYAPVVHVLAAATFAGWATLGGTGWQPALMNAVAVLIITCPCALALAVPVVQVVASARLMREGVLLKTATALERLRTVDTVVFDKTGTLTLGRLSLLPDAARDAEALPLAASLAAASSHPLARALARAAPDTAVAEGVVEVPGRGLAQATPAGEVRLGSRAWCGVEGDPGEASPEIWLARPRRPPVRFAFADALREDAAATVAALRQRGYGLALLSGDRAATVAPVATTLGIDLWRADCLPAEKVARLAALKAEGRRVLMIGDGLNDGPALAAADVSMSPAEAADVSRTAADLVFQGARLAPVLLALTTARRSDRLIRQNIALSIGYNALVVPLAMLGFVTPLIAAIAMSSSSLLVMGNALRLGRGGPP